MFISPNMETIASNFIVNEVVMHSQSLQEGFGSLSFLVLQQFINLSFYFIFYSNKTESQTVTRFKDNTLVLGFMYTVMHKHHTRCGPLRETTGCHHQVSWPMTQPAATEKCKQVSELQIWFYLEDQHMEMPISLLNFVDICFFPPLFVRSNLSFCVFSACRGLCHHCC